MTVQHGMCNTDIISQNVLTTVSLENLLRLATDARRLRSSDVKKSIDYRERCYLMSKDEDVSTEDVNL